CQMIAMTAFMFTQDEVGLFTVSAAFGLGFAGIIPAYVLAIRELYPAAQAYWRIPTFLLCSGGGMALGGWLAGALYDHFGPYARASAAGVGPTPINLAIVGTLVFRPRSRPLRLACPPSGAASICLPEFEISRRASSRRNRHDLS